MQRQVLKRRECWLGTDMPQSWRNPLSKAIVACWLPQESPSDGVSFHVQQSGNRFNSRAQ